MASRDGRRERVPGPGAEGGAVTRRDHEPPRATDRWGWRYHHTGIPTRQRRDGERYLPQFKMYVSGFPESPYGVEWMRFDADSPISDLVKTVPHVAFEVDDIEEALKGKEVLSAPGSPSAGVRVAMIIDNGGPIELMQYIPERKVSSDTRGQAQRTDAPRCPPVGGSRRRPVRHARRDDVD
jgi:hypothetical protein